MIGGGEPLSPRRPSTRTHAPAIMYTGTTARLKAARPPDFRWRSTTLSMYVRLGLALPGGGHMSRKPTSVSRTATKADSAHRCWGGRPTTSRGMCSRQEPFAIYHRWTNSLQAPRSPLCTGRKSMSIWISARSASLLLHCARGGCIPVDRQREDPA